MLLAPLSRTVSLLLVPYLLWVSFATVLNLAIVRLNQPFGAPYTQPLRQPPVDR